MAEPLRITVTGSSLINRPAERAILTINISAEGQEQTPVSGEVRSTTKQVQTILQDLTPTHPETGEATPDAAVTHWSMGQLSTGTRHAFNNEKRKPETLFTARTSFSVKFRDFSRLGTVAAKLSEMPNVSLASITWRLTDATAASLASECRTSAAKDAVARATDYAALFGYQKAVPVKIEDSSMGNPRMAEASLMRNEKAMYLAGETDQELSFHPEDVSLSSSVTITFGVE